MKFQRIELVRPGGERVVALWHRKFSNFARSRILSPSGIAVATAEALYQAAKFPNDRELQLAILGQDDPKEAKRLARRHERVWDEKLKSRWLKSLRLDVMCWVVRRKFAQNPDLASLLAASGNSPIVEPSRFDEYWGLVIPSPERWRGKNHLGRLLMKVRAELSSTGVIVVPEPPVSVP